jgi:two-component system CheB/CheR fusion protein
MNGKAKSSKTKENIKQAPSKKRRSKPFPIVAIGASAGGLEAVIELLKNLAPDTGMAYVYIQHLDPAHKSMLSQILGRSTKMKVLEASNLLPIKANHVYIIPPNKEMMIVDGVLKLNPRPSKPSLSMPIDRFFISLAEKQKEGSIGIVLSGNASDGAIGLKHVKFAGGLTFAQDDSAKFKSMPRSAVAEGGVDLVLSPLEIAKELERLGSKRDLWHSLDEEDEEKLNQLSSNENLVAILQLLKKSTGVDFTHYKKNMIERRVTRRMLLHKFQGLELYEKYLKENKSELAILYQDLLINVTSFFRDTLLFRNLKTKILPGLVKDRHNSTLRIWVPACSTGQEAYSIAMLLAELTEAQVSSNIHVQIFATDLSETAIAKARLGLYRQDELSEISAERLDRFFTKVDGSYRINKVIRDVCVFATHNIFKDPPFSRLDLISCCNLLIYLDNVLQEKILSNFHYALNPEGILILGKAESIGSSSHLFNNIDKRLKIFNKKKNTSMSFSVPSVYEVPKVRHIKTPAIVQNKQDKDFNASLEKIIDNVLLRNYVPACVIVDSDFEILQFRGSTGMYLEPPYGKASFNLLKMIKPGLGFELRKALHKAIKTYAIVSKPGVEFKEKGVINTVSIEIVPLGKKLDNGLFMVLFREGPVQQNGIDLKNNKRTSQLEKELEGYRQDMASIIADREAMYDELQQANEEIVSSNEELQSINEELETSKEEIESTNEELMTINQEVMIRNEQLGESHEYSKAVFETIREAVLILNHKFIVISVNKAFHDTFKVEERDTIGRSIYELGHKQWDIPALRTSLESISRENKQLPPFQVQHDFPDLGKKIMTLSARKLLNKADSELILLVIEDITELVQRESQFRNMANNAPVMIWTAKRNGQFDFLNNTWQQFSGKKLDQLTGMQWADDIEPSMREKFLKEFNVAVEDEKEIVREIQLRDREGQYKWVLFTGKASYDDHGKLSQFIGTGIDINEQKLFRDNLEMVVKQRTKALQDMNTELQQFAFVTSHELQEPLRKIRTFISIQKKMKSREDLEKYVEKIDVSAARMSELIKDLLAYSKVTDRTSKVDKVDLKELMTEVANDFELPIEEKKAKVTIGNLPVTNAIAWQMKQLFANLLNNSLKFSGNRKAHIKISSREIKGTKVEHLKSGLVYHEIVFRDNGIGFDQKYADKIFLIFNRLHTYEEYEGTGIGLALCKKIVENHKGLLAVKSQLGTGTSFYIYLPVL